MIFYLFSPNFIFRMYYLIIKQSLYLRLLVF